jgi:hypothetical protein
MKYARPTTPRTANTAKDTFSTVMPFFGLMGMAFHFLDRQYHPRRCHISSAQHYFNSSPQTGENW